MDTYFSVFINSFQVVTLKIACFLSHNKSVMLVKHMYGSTGQNVFYLYIESIESFVNVIQLLQPAATSSLPKPAVRL